MENPLEEELYAMQKAVLAIKEKANIEHICQDDYETMMIDALNDIGVDFGR